MLMIKFLIQEANSLLMVPIWDLTTERERYSQTLPIVGEIGAEGSVIGASEKKNHWHLDPTYKFDFNSASVICDAKFFDNRRHLLRYQNFWKRTWTFVRF